MLGADVVRLTTRMKRSSRLVAGLSLASLAALTACTSSQVTLEVRSEPGGAKAYINGSYKAVTPCPITFDFSESRYNIVQLVKPGHPVVWATYTQEEVEGREFIRVPMPTR